MRISSKQLKGNKFVNSERQDLHAVIRWLKAQYPNVVYMHDFGADALLTPRQAKERKDLSWGRGWPDLFIFEPRGKWSGLALELKKADAILFNQSGLYADAHLKEQARVHKLLEKRGFFAKFVKGFDGAKEAIDIYLKK